VGAIREAQEEALAKIGVDSETECAIFGGNLRSLLEILRAK
jgi:hypothetical protein